MEPLYLVVLASLALPIVWAISSAMTTDGVKRKFAGMGTITGKTKEEVFSAVGPPNSTSSLGDGKEVLQWQVAGYHIALIFTNNVCDGVSHEYAA